MYVNIMELIENYVTHRKLPQILILLRQKGNMLWSVYFVFV